MTRLRFLLPAKFLVVCTLCCASSAQEGKQKWSAKMLASFKGSSERVLGAALSPDGRILVSIGNRKGEAKIWEAATGKELASPAVAANPDRIAFSGDGRRVLFLSSGSKMVLWDLEKNGIVAESASSNQFVHAVAMNHEGSLYAAMTHDVIGIYQTSGNSLLSVRQKNTYARGAAITPDLKWLAFGNYQDIDVWDLSTGKEAKILGEHRGVVNAITFSRDSKSILAASVRSTGAYQGIAQLKWWDIASGKDRWTFEKESYVVRSLVLSRDEKTIAMLEILEVDGKSEIALIDIPSGRQTFHLKKNNTRFLSPLFVSDDRLLVPTIAEDKTVQFWEVTR